jgi:hypothetical protein
MQQTSRDIKRALRRSTEYRYRVGRGLRFSLGTLTEALEEGAGGNEEGKVEVSGKVTVQDVTKKHRGKGATYTMTRDKGRSCCLSSRELGV